MGVQLDSEFLTYLANCPPSLNRSLPPMNELAETLGMSISKLREQIEVARTLGWVEVKPRTGIQVRPTSPAAALSVSMRFAIARDRRFFDQIEELREVIEASYWGQAVELLHDEDVQRLQELMEQAWALLKGNPIQIPHEEHRKLHLTIFSRLQNEFVKGFLQAYWDAYESVGLNVYTDYPYLEAVWNHHQLMIDAIVSGEHEEGYRALIDHFEILQQRPGRETEATAAIESFELLPQGHSGSDL